MISECGHLKVGAELRVSLKPLEHHVQMVSMGIRRVLNWVFFMPRSLSLMDSLCNFFQSGVSEQPTEKILIPNNCVPNQNENCHTKSHSYRSERRQKSASLTARLIHWKKTMFLFPFKLNRIWRFLTELNSIYFQIERKIVTTIIFHSFEKKRDYCFLSIPNFPSILSILPCHFYLFVIEQQQHSL